MFSFLKSKKITELLLPRQIQLLALIPLIHKKKNPLKLQKILGYLFGI